MTHAHMFVFVCESSDVCDHSLLVGPSAAHGHLLQHLQHVHRVRRRQPRQRRGRGGRRRRRVVRAAEPQGRVVLRSLVGRWRALQARHSRLRMLQAASRQVVVQAQGIEPAECCAGRRHRVRRHGRQLRVVARGLRVRVVPRGDGRGAGCHAVRGAAAAAAGEVGVAAAAVVGGREGAVVTAVRCMCGGRVVRHLGRRCPVVVACEPTELRCESVERALAAQDAVLAKG